VRSEAATAGAERASGEAASSALLLVRAGELLGREAGWIVGTSEVIARAVCARANSVDDDCVGVSIARGEDESALDWLACRATVDDDGAGEGLSDATGDCVGVLTAAAMAVGEGSSAVHSVHRYLETV